MRAIDQETRVRRLAFRGRVAPVLRYSIPPLLRQDVPRLCAFLFLALQGQALRRTDLDVRHFPRRGKASEGFRAASCGQERTVSPYGNVAFSCKGRSNQHRHQPREPGLAEVPEGRVRTTSQWPFRPLQVGSVHVSRCRRWQTRANHRNRRRQLQETLGVSSRRLQ